MKRIDVPETIGDEFWERVRRAAASQVDLIEGPWTDPAKAARKAGWTAAHDMAPEN